MSRLTGLGIVVRSLPQRPDTTNPGIRGGISAGERGTGNRQQGLISRIAGMSAIVMRDNASENATVRGPIVGYSSSRDPAVVSETTAIVITETQKAERPHQHVKGSFSTLIIMSAKCTGFRRDITFINSPIIVGIF
ncbi:Uncharacterized protein DBV15_00059 [Temnothorax longispinosus]|uniref:Uncharacterized protein n=1 Tax=Temnothorax longispinosus TaxID=300112 RepID=A0A4S2KDI8_9HYME|nr:Uncharacterized protein DBV15_00059 [Temnothorax longispinosus]